jgi:hypothetical protein
MMLLKRLLAVAVLAAAVAALLLSGCSKFDPGKRVANIRPETTLSFSPDVGDTANYRVRMNWFGWDVDGEIAYYETIWDWPDSIVDTELDTIYWDQAEWRRVVNTDSVFLVGAAADTNSTLRWYGIHDFAVRAVDNEGAEDLTPEVIAFTAYTVVPDTEILRGPAGVTGPMVTFEWLGSDRDGVIVGYEYRLYRREGNEWFLVTESGLLGADETSTIFGPLAGQHRFEVWSIDDAGADDHQTPASRIFTCNPELAGPKLYIRTNVFGTFAFRGPVWPDEFNLPIPIFAGERLNFDWFATAVDYGGEVLGYRHAYDDTSTWPAWSVFDTHFEVAPDLGRHSLYVSAIDNSNVVTRARIYFEVVGATLDGYILVVDDYDWRETQAAWGTDAARNQFYDGLLAGYARERFEWEPADHIDEGEPQPPDVDILRGASTVIWYCDGNQSTLQDLFDPFETTYNALAGYVRVGGNLILCGTETLMQILDDTYPVQLAATDTLPAQVFVRDYLHIGYAETSGAAANKNSPWAYGYCFYGAVPADPTMFTPVYIDSVGPSGYPEPGKWPLYTNTSPNYVRAGLSKIEKLQAYQGSALEIMQIHSYLNLNFEGETCALLYLSGDNHGNVAYFSFPFYYTQDAQAEPVIDKILELFGEEKLQSP